LATIKILYPVDFLTFTPLIELADSFLAIFFTSCFQFRIRPAASDI
jgi:hypothetical protein